MEKSGRRRRKRVRSERLSIPAPFPSLDLSSFDRTVFPLMLAAACAAGGQNRRSRCLLKHFLRSHIALVAAPTCASLPLPLLLPCGLLSILPLLLTCRCPSLSALSAEFVGAAALCSLESNAMVVSDEEVVNGLLRAVGNQNRIVAEAACNAVMDISVSKSGKDKLIRDFSVIEKLLRLLCQAAASPAGFVSLHWKRSHDHLKLVLDAALMFINTSGDVYLEGIPNELKRSAFPLLKELWKNSFQLELNRKCYGLVEYPNNRKHDLAAAIFRLSMDEVFYFAWEADQVRMAIFQDNESAFEQFLQDCWEVSPLLIRGSVNNFNDKSSILGSLRNSLGCRMNANTLAVFLGQLVSCPPIASDELDIFSFLKEVHNSLGSPITYENDIRVLKTPKFTSESIQLAVKEEIHFFKHFVGSELVEKFSKCEEALQDGYTIALRGMAFRIVEVAAIAEGLSNFFGQPSVGANIYVTPPSSQGLAKHFDDHCVFVCQLFGQKRWRIYPRQEAFLPRLYEPLGGLPSSKYEDDGCMDVLLMEGDILYIPRGYPHEAHTIVDFKEHDTKASSELSMHLTLGIEVEPPFEWEGFAHIALHVWNQKYQKFCAYPIDHEKQKLRSMLVNVLHITLRLIADKDVVFKKACLVAALPFSSNTNCHEEHILLLRQKTTFDYIIEMIDNSSSFSETLLYITTTVHETNENSLQWMRWLRHLFQEEEEKAAFDNPFELLKEFLLLNNNHIKEVAKVFTEMKSEFCGCVSFEDVCDEYKMLLQKYRKTRKQYMNGMLSLNTCFL